MKRFFTFFMVAAISLTAVAQATWTTKPQALKSLMATEHLSNTIKALQQPEPQQATLADEPTWTQHDTTEVIFRSFYDDPIYYPIEVGRGGDTVGGDWYITLHNDRYQFIFDIYGASPETPAGTYTKEDLDEWYSWCMFPEANGKTHYYKTCELTIQEEKLSESLIKFTLDAVMLVTKGIGGEEYGYFKVHAEHTIIRPLVKYDVAILNCVVTPEEDRVRIAGQNDTMDVDLTFFTETGVVGYYSHKIMDTENAKLVHRGVSYEIMDLEGVIYSSPNKAGGVSYVFMFEALTTDASFYNVAMEAPIVPTDTVEFTCNNMLIDDSYGMSDATILITASNANYEIMAGYNANRITSPATYSSDQAYMYLTDRKTGKEITSMICTIEVSGNALKGYQVEIEMLGTDHKYYIMHLIYGVEEARSLDLNFTNSAKSYFYIDPLGSKEVQLANYNGEYSVAFDIFQIDQVIEMGGDFERINLGMEQTFITHHTKDANGLPEDIAVDFAEVSGNVFQRNDTTFLTASVLGFDSCRYNISMFYAVPTPIKTVTCTFDGLANEENVEFINSLSSGIFILDGMSKDGSLMAKVNVERIKNGSVEGTFYNDGKFDHNDFYAIDTYVREWNPTTNKYDEFSVQKGTMTVTVDNGILTAVASFICDNAVQYDLTYKTKFVREPILFDTEEGEMDYTFPTDAEVIVHDFIDGYGMIQLIIADESYAVDFYFNADAMDSVIGVPAGVYPIDGSFESGTVLACKGILPDGPAQSYFCGLDAEGYLDPLQLYCLVDGTVIVENINGKLKVEVDAVNSYDVPVVLHYNAAATALENITTEKVGTQKRLRNGQLYIIRNGETYNANGALVK
mgnify:FL=1